MGLQGGLHAVCNVYGTWGAGSLSYVCVACWQGLTGAGDGSLSVQRCVQRCPCVPSYLPPSKPQGARALARAGAGFLSRCSMAPLPGEGSTAPGKGELILGPYPAGIPAAWATCSVLAPIA